MEICESNEPFPKLTKMSLGSNTLIRSKYGSCFLYENNYDLTENLEKLFKNVPNLKHLKMDAFPDDEIVGNILVKTCKNLVGLSLESNFTNCVDKERLTDEGICDFIEDSNQKLQLLDLSKALSANISAKTIVNLSQLKCLTKLGLHSAQFDHFNLYFKSQIIHSVTHLSINCGFGREKFAHLLSNIDKLFVKLKSLTFQEIVYQSPKEYSDLKLTNLSENLEAFSIEESISIGDLLAIFPKIKELSCMGCYNPPSVDSEVTFSGITKFSLLRFNFEPERLRKILKNMPNLEKFVLVSDTVEVKDVKPNLPLNCDVEIVKENMNKVHKDSFMEF